MLYWKGGMTHLRTYSWPALETVADYILDASGTDVRSYMTPWTDPETDEEVLLVNVNGNLYVASKRYAGVVPYADFEDKSCAAALRDLALISGAYLYVDRHTCRVPC